MLLSRCAATAFLLTSATSAAEGRKGRIIHRIGFTGAWLIIENCVLAKRNVKKATVANFAVTGVVAGVSVRNWRLDR